MAHSLALVPSQPALPATDAAVADEHLVQLWLFGKSEHTQRAYRADAAEFLQYLGRSLADARLEDLHGFAEHLEQRGQLGSEERPLSPTTRARKLAAVKSLLSFAQRTGYTAYNVGAVLTLPKVRRRLAERILPESDVQRMLALEENPRNRAMLRLFYNTGARVSEISALQVRDLSPRQDPRTGQECAQASFFGKGSKERTVLVSPGTWAEIRPLVQGRAQQDPVFRSRKGGGPLDPSWILRLVRKAAKRAGIEKAVSPHWLRHAHASHALDRGAPIHLVQRDLGHESVATTGQYTHARPDQGSGQYLPV